MAGRATSSSSSSSVRLFPDRFSADVRFSRGLVSKAAMVWVNRIHRATASAADFDGNATNLHRKSTTTSRTA